jgi:hypothetical protein
MATVKEVITARSAFDVNLPKVDTLIALANRRINITAFHEYDDYIYATALLVMHWLTLAQMSAALTGSSLSSGPVTSISEGSLSMTFANTSVLGSGVSSGNDYSKTQYGVELSQFLDISVDSLSSRMG